MIKKIILFSIPVLIVVIFTIFHLNRSQPYPFSSQQQYLQQLKHALYLAKLDSGQINIQPALRLVNLTLESADQPTFTAIISLQKDPYQQIIALQQIIKKAKIKHKVVLFADLALVNPYATLTNP